MSTSPSGRTISLESRNEHHGRDARLGVVVVVVAVAVAVGVVVAVAVVVGVGVVVAVAVVVAVVMSTWCATHNLGFAAQACPVCEAEGRIDATEYRAQAFDAVGEDYRRDAVHWMGRARAVENSLAASEAACAAMREALKAFHPDRDVDPEDDSVCAECGSDFYLHDGAEPCPECDSCAQTILMRARPAAKSALSPDAGRDVLAVVDAARKHADWHNNKGPDEDDGLAELLAKLDWEGG